MESEMVESFDELEDSSDSGSDYEATLKNTKRKKGAAPSHQPPKRPKRKAVLRVTPSPSSSPSPSPQDPSQQKQTSHEISSPASLRPMPAVTGDNQSISAAEIYDAVRSGKSAMVTVVDEWLDNYKRSREAGLLELINFIFLSCGCKGVVNREMFDTMQNAEIISVLTEKFTEDPVKYPLCTPDHQLKQFKKGLFEFARVLVRSCRNSIIYDEYLFPSLLSLLTGMSDSPVRAFRHTSTLLAMKLTTGLVDVAVMVSAQLQTTQRQYDSENSKGVRDRASERLEVLQATIRELRENQEELSSLINATYRGVFVHRYRDILPEIRSACIEEMGIWLKTDPENFLNDGCLKYLGWLLHDKQSPVRMQCVRALQALYKEKEFVGRLELFTSRFKERMRWMAIDKDRDVAVEAINLLLLIQQGTEDGLTEEECGYVYSLVYAAHRGQASAAGSFLFNKFKSLMSDYKENARNTNATILQILISFFIQSEYPDHGTYLVDSLWDVAGSVLRDWETMTAFLLQEAGLMYEEEGALIELMMGAMRQAAQATPPVGRTHCKKILSMKDKKTQEQDRRRITTHFIPLLPQLLVKYSADTVKLTFLLKAPLYFDLEMYQNTQRMEKHLDLLLSQICGIVEKHTDATVLEACAHVVNALCSDSYSFSSRAHLAFSQLLDNLTECFSIHLNDLLRGATDEDDTYSATSALKRIAALCSAKDLTRWKLFDPCVDILKSRLESPDLNKELMVLALKCAAFHLIWARRNVDTSSPTEAELKRLKKDVHRFCRICQTCLSLNRPEIRDQAFEQLCDLLLWYSSSSLSSQPSLQTLIHLPSASLRSELASFLLDHVFYDADDVELYGMDEEMKITLLQRKRKQLAGFCKLVVYSVLDLTAATNVFKHYSKYFREFGDIIKLTVDKTKLINPVASARTICLSLQQLFSEMLMDDPSRQDLGEIRDLAKRLARSFGVDLHRARKPVMALHKDGIHFAFQESQEGHKKHPNVAFLEILSQFTCKVLLKDRSLLISSLKAECPSAALSWAPVRIYQHSLEGRSAAKPRAQKERGEAVSLQESQVAKRRRTSTKGSASSTVRGSFLDSSIQSVLPTPAFTSTVRKLASKQAVSKKSRAKAASGFTELDCEDEFSTRSYKRKVTPAKRRRSPTVDEHELNTNLTLLSLIDNEEEAENQDYKSDKADYTSPSTCHTSVGILEKLFD